MNDDADARSDTGDGSWMTYGQLAEARQIGRRAAVRLAQRHRLRRQPGNDGSVRVWVPADMAVSSAFRPFPPASPPATVPASPEVADVRPDASADAPQALGVLEAALRAADARADAAQALVDRLVAELADARADAGVRLDRVIGDLAAAEARARDAEQAARIALGTVESLQRADEARKARGRLRRAWDGWRGR